MIPKTIHYCWFGNNPMPKSHKKFIKEWRKRLPDYELRLWSDNDLDRIEKPHFVKEAIANKKYAFVADYIRLYALFNYGGIYLDTDVKVCKSFDPYLDNRFFSSVEYHPSSEALCYIDSDGNIINKKFNYSISIHSAIIASEKGHPYIKECLESYYTAIFDKDNLMQMAIPRVLAMHAEKYGFKYKNEKQELLEGIIIFPAKVFAEYRTCDRDSVAIHYCEGSWLKQTKKMKLMKLIKKNPILFAVYRSYKKIH